MADTITRWIRAVAAALVLVALVVGIPILLATIAGWPLPRQMPDWERVARMLRQNDIRAEPVINTIAVIAWLAWAQLAWAIAWEFVVNLPAARDGRPTSTAPLTAGPVRSAVARLVAVVVAAGVLSSGTTAVAAGLPTTATRLAPPAAADTTLPEHAASGAAWITSSSPSPATATAPTWEIERGDTLWDIAETTLGDGLRVAELLDLNPQITSPRTLQPGQIITLPIDATIPDDRRRATVSAGASDTTGTVSESEIPAATVTIAEGDTLWGVAQAHLEAHGRSGDREVARYLPAVVAANNDTIDDPDFIHPGLTVHLPAIDHDPHRIVIDPEPDDDSRPTSRTDQPAPDEPEADRPAGLPHPTVPDDHPDPPTVTTDTADTLAAAPITVPPAGVPDRIDATAGDVPSTTAVVTEASETQHDIEEASPFDTSTRTVWWSVPGSLLLAAGVTAMVRRLRSRRLARVPPGEQLPPPSDVAAGVELALRSRQPTERIHTLHALLATLTPHARATRDMPMVRALEFDDDRVEVLLTRPAPITPPGWSTIDGGTSWIHRRDDPIAEGDRPIITPTLVTLGRRNGGGELLLDLETAGSLSITGDRDAALGAARAIAYELGTSPLGTMADLSLIGLDVEGLHHCDRVWSYATLANAAQTTQTAAPDDWIAARVGDHEGDERPDDPHVYVIDLDAIPEDQHPLIDQLVDNCIPGSCRSVVLVGEHDKAREHVHVDSTELAFWSGAQLQPVIVTTPAVAEVATAFESAATDETTPIKPPRELRNTDVYDRPAHQRWSSAKTNGDGDEEIAEPDDIPPCYEPPDFDVLVKTLGEVTVVGRDITAPMDVEMLALLACMRMIDRRPNIDTIDAMLGRDNALKTLQSRMSRIRAKLGVGGDDHDLLPPAGPTTSEPGRYHLSRRVLTDIDLIEHRYHAATELASGAAIDVLRDGLSLFAGPPLRGPRTGFGWAYTEGVISRTANIVNAYAALLMQLAFEANDIPLVLDAVGAAARVLEDPIAQHPMRDVERELADVCSDPALLESVAEARHRLIQHAQQQDALSDG